MPERHSAWHAAIQSLPVEVNGVNSRYDVAVVTRELDRQRWAAIVRRLMDKHAGGKKATFAKLVDVDPRTVTDWLNGTYRVREAMVRQVAERTGENAIELLVELGVQSPDDLGRPARPADPIAPEDAWIVEHIKANFPHLTASQRDRLIAVQLDEARREREERLRRINESVDLMTDT